MEDFPTIVLATRRLGDKGRLQIPREVRKILSAKEGDLMYFLQDEDAKIILEKAPTLNREGKGKYVVRASPLLRSGF